MRLASIGTLADQIFNNAKATTIECLIFYVDNVDAQKTMRFGSIASPTGLLFALNSIMQRLSVPEDTAEEVRVKLVEALTKQAMEAAQAAQMASDLHRPDLIIRPEAVRE